MMSGGCFLLEFFWGYPQPLCHRECRDPSLWPRGMSCQVHCVPEDMGVFLSQHSWWQPPPCLFAPVTKEEEGQTVAQPGPVQGPRGERFQATAGPQLPRPLASRTAPSCHFPFSTSSLISFLKDFEATSHASVGTYCPWDASHVLSVAPTRTRQV